MVEVFQNDSKDRKRRFLRGLNCLLGLNSFDLENKDVLLREAITPVNLPGFRNRLADIYCLEFTIAEIAELMNNDINTGEFTEKYCEVIYQTRGDVDLNSLISSSMKDGAIDPMEMDKAPKYGLNGFQWCDVAEGPCSCGAYH